MVVTAGIVWVFQIFVESQKLSISTENRIIALQIAREGIEAFSNIRETNWFLFAADTKNCWNTLNYNSNCISANNTTYDILHSRSFTTYQGSDNKWYLSQKSNNESRVYSDINYRNDYRVNKDANGFYTQSWGTNFNPIFTREIKVLYQDTNGGALNSQDEKVEVKSIVQWKDSNSELAKKVEISTIFTNWK